jgi:hypothetical protein
MAVLTRRSVQQPRANGFVHFWHSYPILPAKDSFDRANANPVDGAWTTVTSQTALQISSNKAIPANAANDCAAFYNALPFPNDQYAQAKVSTAAGAAGGGTGIGPMVRCSAADNTNYRVVITHGATNNITLGKFVASAFTEIWQRTVTFVDGDILRLEVQGTTLRVYVNGVQVGADATDSSIASGAAGIAYSSNLASCTADDWEAGELVSGGTSFPVTQTDDAGLTDTVALTQSKVVTDDSGLTDSTSITQSKVLTDDAGLTDTSTVQIIKAVTQTDDTGLTDTSALTQSKVVTDSIGLTDTVSTTQSKAPTDDTGLTDTSTVQLVKAVTQTDDVGLTDSTALTQSKAVTDSTGLTDTTAATQAKVVTDDTGLTDTTVVSSGKLITQTDDVGLTDSVAQQQTKVVSDSIGLTDTSTTAGTFSRTQTDTTGLTDTSLVQLIKPIVQTDNVGLTDSVGLQLLILRIIDDSIGLTDTATIEGIVPVPPIIDVVWYDTSSDVTISQDNAPHDSVGDRDTVWTVPGIVTWVDD